MKNIFFILLILSSCTNSSTAPNNESENNKSNKEHIQSVDNVADAVMYIESHQGDVSKFRLALTDIILYSGMNVKHDFAVQVIEKKVISTKGWLFDGYEKKGDLYIYKFKKK